MRSVVKHTIAAIVVAALPVAGFAQSQSAAQGNPAAEHLAAARAALNKVLNAPAPSGDAFKKLSELKTEYIALEKSASTASPDWASHYANIDRVVGELIGAPAAASGESGAVGTSGHAGAMKGVEPGVAADLSTFRNELKAFSTAMSAVAPASGAASTAASASPAPAAAPSTPSSAPAPAAPPTAATSAASPSAPTSGSVVSGTAPKSTPLQAPAAPVAASGSSATAATPTGTSGAATGTSATGTSPTAEPGLAAQLDPVIALVDAALAANPVDASGKVTVDRATLDAIKAQLQVIKAKKQ
jgi:outer membrane murein-binding lipoprotein Lpp